MNCALLFRYLLLSGCVCVTCVCEWAVHIHYTVQYNLYRNESPVHVLFEQCYTLMNNCLYTDAVIVWIAAQLVHKLRSPVAIYSLVAVLLFLIV